MPTNPKFEKLLTKYAREWAQCGRDLAMNFDVPARDTIAMCAREMGISIKMWNEIASYVIAKEQTA